MEYSGANKGEVKYTDSENTRSYNQGAIPKNSKFDTYNDKFSWGFAMATGVFNNSLFSYRLNAGVSYSGIKFKKADEKQAFQKDKKYKMTSVITNHDFLFNLNRGDQYRFWIGPAVHSHIGIAENRRNKKETMALVGLGVGPAIAMDFVQASSIVTLKLGARYLAYAGVIEEDRAKDEYDLRLDAKEVYFNISALF